MKSYIYLIVAILSFSLHTTYGQGVCSGPVTGVVVSGGDSEDEVCMRVVSPSLDPNVGFIVGTTYTLEIDWETVNVHCPSGPGNCAYAEASWTSSNNVELRANSTERVPLMSLTILDENPATVSFTIDYVAGPFDEDECNTNCSFYGEMQINAVPAVDTPYSGICSDLCAAIGLQTGGFEGEESNILPLWNPEVRSTDGAVLSIEENDFQIINAVTDYRSVLERTASFLWTPFNAPNQRALVIGDDLNEQDAEIASVEQEFFVQEHYDPRLDIHFAWVAEKASNKEKVIFKIELFRLYDGGYDQDNQEVVGEELVYLYTEKEGQGQDRDYDDEEGDKVFRHFWDKKTIDLTPYKLERLKLKISTIDRTESSTAKNTRAVVDISCSTCCSPDETVNYSTPPQQGTLELYRQNEINGFIRFTRHKRLYEHPSIALNDKRRKTPIFIYQIISPNGESRVIDDTGVHKLELQALNAVGVRFRVYEAGTHQIRYKETSSCCWSDYQSFEVTSLEAAERPTFSNDLKAAAAACLPTFEIDSVLAVNVASFNEHQLIDPTDVITSNRTALIEERTYSSAPKNPFLTGERGIWRTEGSYAYVTDRKGEGDISTELVSTDEQSEKVITNAIRYGGIFDLSMFNWKKQGVMPEKWRKVNSVSRYDGYTHEIENRDILGRYSAALYGYDGQLATAVCSNAAYYEIAQEGFDAYATEEKQKREQMYEKTLCMPQDGGHACVEPYVLSQITIRSGGANSNTYDVEPVPLLGYEVGKLYAFSVVGRCVDASNIDNDPYNDAFDWIIQNNWLERIAEDEKHIVVRVKAMPSGDDPFFDIKYNFSESYLNACSFGGFSSLRAYYRQDARQKLSTETNFTVNNLYKNGAKDRNVVLQVLWAQGSQGILEGYTPGEGQSLEIGASILGHTIGSERSFAITADFEENTTDPTITYDINEKVRLRLRHRDAKTSWFEVLPNTITGYTLPEEWTSKNEEWIGSVRLARQLPFLRSNNEEISSYRSLAPIAHTGKVSLAPSEKEIVQEKLLLIPEKDYLFSAWVRLGAADDQALSYEGVGARLRFYDNNGNQLFLADGDDQIYITPTGGIIEGWQRIEGRFTVPSRNMFVSVQLEGLVDNVLYDDIRIYPAEGMMKSYVYDPATYLLEAVLDENNYATLYFYDEEQRLYLVQKETREGVQTIQESRSYIKPRLEE